MLRRDFIKTTASLLAVSTLPATSVLAEADVPRSRSVFTLNRNWRFLPAAVEGAHLPAFDDAAFEKIVIPHTNVKLPWHSFDDKEYQFISTYRRRFKYPAAARGKRVFVDFEGAMTASTVWINGVPLGEYKGGFTPFSFELTPHLRINAENVLVVQLDSTERADIPPFGGAIDYLTFGGIYREVSLSHRPAHPPRQHLRASHRCPYPQPIARGRLHGGRYPFGGRTLLEAELRDGDQAIANMVSPPSSTAPDTNASTDPDSDARVHGSTETSTDPACHTVSLTNLGHIKLWELRQPASLYGPCAPSTDSKVIDEDTRRIGFREARFTDRGFSLNGKILKLRGLDRHQTFPFVGQAMPARAQRQRR